MINISNIYIKFDEVVIEDGNLDIYNGQLTGIIGESGSGKTSILQEIGLLNKHMNMKYIFDNQLINEMNLEERTERLRKDISFIMQDIYFFDDLTILEICQLYGGLVNKKINENHVYDLLHYVNLELSPQTSIMTLSGGEKQRLSIACGLLKDAKLFIFDEPFAYLDDYNKQNIVDILKKLAYEENKMVIITTHNQEVWEQLDQIYTISNKHIILSKNSKCESITEKSHQQYVPFHFNILKQYINLYNKNYKWRRLTICLFLSTILSLLVVMGKFDENYQKANGESLLNLMKNEVLVINDDGEKITPKQQTLLRFHLRDYEIYPEYIDEGDDEIFIKGYLDNEIDSFKIYKDLESHSILNSKVITHPIYVSYSLYRKNGQNSQIHYVDSNQKENNIQYSYILNPALETKQTIFLPYQDYIQYLQQRNIDLELVDIIFLKIPINSIQEINEINKRLPTGFSIYEDQIIGVSLQTIKFLNQTYIYILSGLILCIITFYKIFDFIRKQKDIALWKMLGVNFRNLIKMKIYQETKEFGITFLVSIVLSCLLMYILNILYFKSFINVFIWLFIFNFVTHLVLIIIYSVFISKFSVSQLLKAN